MPLSRGPQRAFARALGACLAAACLLFVGSCSQLSPEEVTGEVKMLVLGFDQSAGQYKLVIGRVKTLHHLRTLDGDAATMLGGADIRVDYDTLARANPQTAEDLEALTYRTKGKPVDFAYFEVNGILHPEDFHSLSLATTYYNFEKAHLFFVDLNAGLYQLPVQYFPTMEEGTAANLRELTDNAFWDPILHTFVVLPFKDVKELPLGMNVGVVAHEYTHAVFSNRAFKGDGVPWLYQKYFTDPEKYSAALNLNRSFNEGLADFFGAAISGDPAFVRKSLSEIAEERRLDPLDPRCLQRDVLDAQQQLPNGKYDPYPMGSVLAAALWEAVASSPDRQEAFARGLVDAMTELGERFDAKEEKVELADAVDAVASKIVADLQPKTCGLLIDRFHLDATQVPSCGEVKAPEHKCPR